VRRYSIGARSQVGAYASRVGGIALACCLYTTTAHAITTANPAPGGAPARTTTATTAATAAAAGTAGTATTAGTGRTGEIVGTDAADGSMGMLHDPAPDPGLGPDEVVGIVLHALQHNDDPVADHGIAITFAFTSPENHDVTGPLDRFRALVKSPAYRLMIGHTRADRGPVTVVAQHAREQVAITGAHGERALYVFLLSRQEIGAHKGCWMADGVLREADPVLDTHDRSMMTAVAFPRE
jgi:hypothetical protein